MSLNKYDSSTGELTNIASGSRIWTGTKAAYDAQKQAGTLPNNALIVITDDEQQTEAEQISYDNTDSGLTADNVQDAIDEINNDLNTNPILLGTLQTDLSWTDFNLPNGTKINDWKYIYIIPYRDQDKAKVAPQIIPILDYPSLSKDKPIIITWVATVATPATPHSGNIAINITWDTNATKISAYKQNWYYRIYVSK